VCSRSRRSRTTEVRELVSIATVRISAARRMHEEDAAHRVHRSDGRAGDDRQPRNAPALDARNQAGVDLARGKQGRRSGSEASTRPPLAPSAGRAGRPIRAGPRSGTPPGKAGASQSPHSAGRRKYPARPRNNISAGRGFPRMTADPAMRKSRIRRIKPNREDHQALEERISSSLIFAAFEVFVVQKVSPKSNGPHICTVDHCRLFPQAVIIPWRTASSN